MVKPETKKILEDMGRTNYGKALTEYLDDSIMELRNIMTISSYEELLGRQWVEKYLKKLMSFLEQKETVDRKKTPYV